MGLERVCVSMFGWTVRLLQLLIPAETAVPRKYQQNLSYKPVSFPPPCVTNKARPFRLQLCALSSLSGYFSLSQDDATNKTFGPQVLSRRSKSCNGLQEGNQWKDDERLKIPLSHSVHCWGAVCDQGATLLSCWIGRWILLWWLLTEIMWPDLREKTQTLEPVGN